MNKKLKNLSMSQVNQENAAKYKDLKRVSFDGAKIDIDVRFRPSKRTTAVSELLNVLQEAFKNNKKIDASIGVGISTSIIIKNFTSIETDAEGYDGLLALLAALKDASYLDKIVESFNEDELNTMLNEMNEAIQKVVAEFNNSVQEDEEMTEEDA